MRQRLREMQLYTLPSRIAFAGWTEETLKTYAGPTPEIVRPPIWVRH